MDITNEEMKITKDTTYEELLQLYTKQSRMIRTVLKQSDTQTKQLLDLNEKLLKASNTDPMTGAYNRRYFFSIAKKIVSISKREKKDLTVAMLDIDKFKNINDTYGHDIGDVIIKDLTKQLDHALRDSDTFARFGGEEFVVLLQNTDTDGALNICEKIRLKIENSTPVDDIKYTVSIGVSKYKYNDSSLDEMIKRSDLALYEAKESGRNKVVIWEEN